MAPCRRRPLNSTLGSTECPPPCHFVCLRMPCLSCISRSSSSWLAGLSSWSWVTCERGRGSTDSGSESHTSDPSASSSLNHGLTCRAPLPSLKHGCERAKARQPTRMDSSNTGSNAHLPMTFLRGRSAPRTQSSGCWHSLRGGYFLRVVDTKHRSVEPNSGQADLQQQGPRGRVVHPRPRGPCCLRPVRSYDVARALWSSVRLVHAEGAHRAGRERHARRVPQPQTGIEGLYCMSRRRLSSVLRSCRPHGDADAAVVTRRAVDGFNQAAAPSIQANARCTPAGSAVRASSLRGSPRPKRRPCRPSKVTGGPAAPCSSP